MTDQISIDDFSKVDIRVGEIRSAEIIEDADRLLKLSVDLGEDEPRTIVSGIREHFSDEHELEGVKCAFVTNLPVRLIKGVESHGMILAAQYDQHFSLFRVSANTPPGAHAS